LGAPKEVLGASGREHRREREMKMQFFIKSVGFFEVKACLGIVSILFPESGNSLVHHE
jgi:hypothetical protein